MTRETRSEQLQRRRSRERKDSVTGIVTKVFQHDGTEKEPSNHEVNVQYSNRAEEVKRIPVLSDRNGSVSVPQVGDAVEVDFFKGLTQRPYVASVIHTDKNRAPLARSGHFRRRFGPDDSPALYLEAEPSDHSAGTPDVVRIAKKPDGVSDPTTTVEVDDSGSKTAVTVETDGDITLKADGNIVIDNGGTPKPSLTKDAVLEYEDTQPDGSTAIKETKTVSNNETTSTKID